MGPPGNRRLWGLRAIGDYGTTQYTQYSIQGSSPAGTCGNGVPALFSQQELSFLCRTRAAESSRAAQANPSLSGDAQLESLSGAGEP